MARMIRVTGTGPIKIEPQEKAVFICGCGLTKKFPFCDGTHKCCKEEEPEALYRYDAETNEAVRIEPPTDAG
ncbi:MAG: CDGSH iron-sulfur domain-containing protein [Planctomycetota bacterium]|jgi:CDGSH-type Zn-finger protein|nr:CDGSH iron-sulfur domain-containing protein [Planctomycetota bacterium]